MRDRLKRLREAATRAVDAARTGPADALKNVTESMLRRASSAGLPSDAVTAGSAAAARLWTRVAPGDPLALARLGEALIRDGDVEGALAVLAPGAARDGDAALLAEAWLARAEVLTGKSGEAAARIDRAAARLPTRSGELDAQIRGVIAAAALDGFRPEQALRVLGEGGEDPLRMICKARLALAAGDLDGGTAHARHAAAAGLPEEAAPWIGLAAALAGDRKEATAALAAVHTRGPDRAFADVGGGWLRIVSGGGDASTFLRRALERNPLHPGAHYLLGLLAERGGDLDEARRCYEEATSGDSRWPEPWTGLARIAVAASDFEGARAAAARAGDEPRHLLLAGVAAGLGGDARGAERAWELVANGSTDRTALRDVASLRAALAWQLAAKGRHEAAAAVWTEVARRASHAGPTRAQLARWALDSARISLEASQPAFYAVESALAAAAGLRVESEELVVAHCSATFLARGPAAARTALERAVARGSSNGRILSLLGLIDAAVRGSPMPAVTLPRSPLALEAAGRARAGDAAGCVRLIDEAVEAAPPAAVRAVATGARALARLGGAIEQLRRGELAEVTESLAGALDHLPPGPNRDEILHDLAAVRTVLARRLDAETRARGEPPSEEATTAWQAALRDWTELGRASAYWADLARRVLELDDSRVTPHDVDVLRARLHHLAAGLPASLAREAVDGGHLARARAFVNLLLGAPIDDSARLEALVESLAPLTAEASRFSAEASKTATTAAPGTLPGEWSNALARVHDLLGQLHDASPQGVGPVVDARDELALGLVAFFENLHDRAGETRLARAALAEAASVAGSDSLRSELEGKVARMGGTR